jgi:hypothetical protein
LAALLDLANGLYVMEQAMRLTALLDLEQKIFELICHVTGPHLMNTRALDICD